MKKITFHISVKPDGFDQPVLAWAQGYQAAPGLAIARAHTIYHGWDGKSIMEQGGAWYVYHIASGILPCGESFSRRKDAQRFAELLAPHLDWTQDQATIERTAAEADPKLGPIFRGYYRQIIEGEDKPPEDKPEDAPRPLPVATIPGGFTVRAKELNRALKGTSQAVKFGGIVVNPQVLREIGRLHPLLEIRPARGELRLTTPNGRTHMRLLDGANVKHEGRGYSAEIRPVVRLAAAAD